MTTVSLIDVSTYLPENRVPAEWYAEFAGADDLRDNLMFRAPKFRHHVGPDESAIDMVERAAAGLIDRHVHDVLSEIDAPLATRRAQGPLIGDEVGDPLA